MFSGKSQKITLHKDALRYSDHTGDITAQTPGKTWLVPLKGYTDRGCKCSRGGPCGIQQVDRTTEEVTLDWKVGCFPRHKLERRGTTSGGELAGKGKGGTWISWRVRKCTHSAEA